MTKSRSRAVLATVLAAGLASAGLVTTAPAQPEIPTAVLAAPSMPPRDANPKGELFFDRTVSIRVVSEPVVLSNRSDGTGAFTVDDLMTVTVTRPDGSKKSLSHNFSNGCTKLSKSGPFNITSLTAPGVNQVRIQMRDVCGVKVGSSTIWAYNLDTTPTPSPSSSEVAPSDSPSSPPPEASPASPTPTDSTSPSPSPSPSPDVNVTAVDRHSPDIKWVGYLHSTRSGARACIGNLSRKLNLPHIKAVPICALFHLTSNPRPPRSFTPASWGRFKRSKEYRSFIRIHRIDYSCRGDVITKLERPVLERSGGYTPSVGIKWVFRRPVIHPRSSFVGSESFTQRKDLPFNRRGLNVYRSRDGRAVTVSYLQASRLSLAFRIWNYFGIGSQRWLRTGYDAPFIWTYVRVRLTCRGAGIKIVSSSVPSRSLYINNRRKYDMPQSADLATFIKSGRRKWNSIGRGFLDPKCRKQLEVFWGRVQFPSKLRQCLTEIPGWKG